MAKYELLVKRDQDMTAFIDSFDATRAGIIAEQQAAQFVIVALLEDISKVRTALRCNFLYGSTCSAMSYRQRRHRELELFYGGVVVFRYSPRVTLFYQSAHLIYTLHINTQQPIFLCRAWMTAPTCPAERLTKIWKTQRYQ